MREIKLRAWNKLSKKLLEPDSEEIKWYPLRMFFEVNSVRDVYDWMQYTGLKDKNGKEIYEGDILVDEDCSGYIGIVSHGDFYDGEYSSYGFHVSDAVRLDYDGPTDKMFVTGEKMNRCEKLTTSYCCEDTEVIGNIYENPELMCRGEDR